MNPDSQHCLKYLPGKFRTQIEASARFLPECMDLALLCQQEFFSEEKVQKAESMQSHLKHALLSFEIHSFCCCIQSRNLNADPDPVREKIHVEPTKYKVQCTKGVRESQFQRLEKRLSLCLLCGIRGPQHTRQKSGGTCDGGDVLWLGANIEEDGPLHPRDHEVGSLPNHLLLHALEPMRRGPYVSSVLDPDPDWIRIQRGPWIRIRIKEGKNYP